jgi:hypothetical protein
MKLRAGHIGYESRVVEVALRERETVAEITIETSQVTLGLEAIVVSTPRPLWKRAGFSVGRIVLDP